MLVSELAQSSLWCTVSSEWEADPSAQHLSAGAVERTKTLLSVVGGSTWCPAWHPSWF
jgi:hypothetical protein